SSRRGEPPLSLFQNGNRGGRAEARRTRAEHSEGGVQRPDASRGLHTDAGADRRAHQPHVGGGGAGGRKSRRSFHEVGAGALRSTAGFHFFIVGQISRLENHFQQDARGLRNLHDAANVGFEAFIFPRLQRADVQDHIQFLGARKDGGFGFAALRPSGRGAEGETHHRGGF